MEEVTLHCPECGEDFKIPLPEMKLEIVTCDNCGNELSAWNDCCVVCKFSGQKVHDSDT